MSVVETVSARPGAWARVYSAVSVVLAVLILAQFLFAGLGVFTIMDSSDSSTPIKQVVSQADTYWGLHFFNALLMAAVMLVLIGVAFAARKPWRTTGLTALLLVLLVLQAVLAFTPVAPIAALHVLNALLILAVAGVVIRGNWAF